jgi:diguanylate cyclase (GGDEF)-like protein
MDIAMRLTTDPGSLSTSIEYSQPLTYARAWLAVAVSAAVIFVFDRGTGLIGVQHLYYFPIIVAAIRFGTRGGVLTAAVAIVLYHLADARPLTFRYGESDLLQIAVFIAVGVVSARLASDARRLHALAMTDDLTGLHNLRSFERELRKMVRAARDGKTPLSLLVLDVDRLKSVNDVHGHLAGAEAVRTIGRIIAANIPYDAVACRYGGDEFAIVVPRCPAPMALGVAHDLRRAVEAETPALAGLRFPEKTLSVSVGVTTRSFAGDAAVAAAAATDDETGEALFRVADAALYSAKNGGRNRVHPA